MNMKIRHRHAYCIHCGDFIKGRESEPKKSSIKGLGPIYLQFLLKFPLSIK